MLWDPQEPGTPRGTRPLVQGGRGQFPEQKAGTADMLPRTVPAALARDTAASHAAWDSPAELTVLHSEDGALQPGNASLIDTAVHPGAYPSLIADCAARAAAGPRAAYALQLRFEAHGVKPPGPGASPRDRALHTADRKARTFRLRQDSHEIVMVYIADIYGRLWSAMRERGHDTVIERFHRPGGVPDRGPIPRALLRAAEGLGRHPAEAFRPPGI